MTEYTKYTFNITPIAKPRMVKSDVWIMGSIKRGTKPNRKYIGRHNTLTSYMNFAESITLQALELEIPLLPSILYSVNFYLPIPSSMSQKKKDALEGSIHTKRPDLDNLLKALQDVLCKNDSHIACIRHGLGKYYSSTPRIEISI